jgi:glycosyltransferase involved in cell wall biosynthesis
MAAQAVVVSYRLGGDDGVSVEARKWGWALGELGFEVRRVAGEIEDAGHDDDVVLPGLAIGAPGPPDRRELRDALDGADLVVVENLCSLPLEPRAAEVTAAVVAETRSRVVLRHHDLPWQRRRFAHLEDRLPPHVPGALHATVNHRSRRELVARGYARVCTIHNRFDLDPAPGDRDATRAAFGFAVDELVVFQPARAIERKNVPGGIRFAARLGARLRDRPVRYWLSGPAEEGYGPVLERLVARAPVPVTVGRAAASADAYAACDVVAFPSTWEGFGNPTVESVAARRPCAAFAYPVLAEILAAGVRLFAIDDPDAVARFLLEPDEVRARAYEANVRRARVSFSIAGLPGAIEEAFRATGWAAW